MACVGVMFLSPLCELFLSLDFSDPAMGSEVGPPYSFPLHIPLTQPWLAGPSEDLTPKMGKMFLSYGFGMGTEALPTRLHTQVDLCRGPVNSIAERVAMQKAEEEAGCTRDNTESPSTSFCFPTFNSSLSLRTLDSFGVLKYPDKTSLKLVLFLAAKDSQLNTILSQLPCYQANNGVCWMSTDSDQREADPGEIGEGTWYSPGPQLGTLHFGVLP